MRLFYTSITILCYWENRFFSLPSI